MTTPHTPLTFRPVPAVPITVLAQRKGDCWISTAIGTFNGDTLQAALQAALRAAQEKRG